MKRFLFLCLLLLSACTTAPQRSAPPPVLEGSAGEVYREPAAPAAIEAPAASAPTSGAVVALLDRADGYRRSGDSGNEAATIERALRIDPKNAGLWGRLAAVRLDQEQPEQAVQLAMKSNGLASGDVSLQARNWRLIATARRMLGDAAGARDAERRAAALQ